MMPEQAVGILVAAGLGSLIGVERELTGQLAGLRTHMILCVGAALAAILSISYSEFISSPNMPSDPGRIVAQVVSGVGFLGAGAILRHGFTIKGLTTASSLWTTAIIGIAAGSGYYQIAAFTTVIVLLILTVINKIESFVFTTYRTHNLNVSLDDRPGIVNDLKEVLTEEKVKVVSLNASMPDKSTLNLSLVIRKPVNLGMDKIINIVNGIEEAKSMSIEK